MSRLDQGPITGEMRLGFLVQDICICIFTSWSSPTRRAGLDDSPQPCQCIASKRLHSVCPMPMCRKETPPRVPPSFSFIFIFLLFFFILPDTITDPLFEGKVCCPVQVQGHPRILP